MDNNLELFTSNINALLSIYFDSDVIRNHKAVEIEKNLPNWSDKDFDDFTHYTYHFDWLLLQSLFISGFAYFESFMRITALSIEKNKNKIKLEDIKGNGHIDTYRKYIHLIGGIEFASSDRKEWQIINEFKTIRNSLTHDNGKISKKLNKIEQHKIYFGQSNKIIRIKNVQFLEDFCKTAIEYMEAIVSEIKK